MNHIKKYALSFLIGGITFYTIGSMITYIPHVASQNPGLTKSENVVREVRNHINTIQNTSIDDRGFFGDIIAGIFLRSGKISTVFISAFRHIDDADHNNTVPRWIKTDNNLEGVFEPGTIQDDGTNVGIGRDPTDSDTGPRLIVDGGIVANEAIVATRLTALYTQLLQLMMITHLQLNDM